MKLKNKIVYSDEGYSLVESLVAMAILLTVLVPSAMFLTYIGNNVLAKDKITSFNHARNQMEYVLATQNDSTIVRKLDSDWWVKRSIANSGNLKEITVQIFKDDTLSEATITLKTARLWYSEN
ncbi:MAG: type IV pilus modification PilV family protein [Balneola sp.]